MYAGLVVQLKDVCSNFYSPAPDDNSVSFVNQKNKKINGYDDLCLGKFQVILELGIRVYDFVPLNTAINIAMHVATSHSAAQA